jgi:hypothetical protein
VVMPTTQPVRPERGRDPKQNAINLEQPLHKIYSYAAVTDSEEGLILVNVETMEDFEPRNNFFNRALTWNPDGILDGAVHAAFMGHVLWVSADKGLVGVDLNEPLEPKLLAVVPLNKPRAAMGQFRYLFAVDADGFKVVDVTDPAKPKLLETARVPIVDAKRVFVARTYAYVAAGSEGIVIIDVQRPEKPQLYKKFNANGQLNDARDIVVAATNASLFAYVADGKNGMKVVQLISPESNAGFYGFSPEPQPELIAWRRTRSPALALSRPLERDRAVDETGHQVGVIGRIGARPFNLEEMQRLYMKGGDVWKVSDQVKPGDNGAKSGSCNVAPQITRQQRPLGPIGAVAD